MVGFVSAVLIIAYVALAIWVVCKRRSILGCVAAGSGFIAGGVAMVAVSAFLAELIIGIAIIGIIIAICSMFSG